MWRAYVLFIHACVLPARARFVQENDSYIRTRSCSRYLKDVSINGFFNECCRIGRMIDLMLLLFLRWVFLQAPAAVATVLATRMCAALGIRPSKIPSFLAVDYEAIDRRAKQVG